MHAIASTCTENIPSFQQPVFVWLDLEMTGLDPRVDRILELAILVTDRHLNLQATLGPYPIYQPAAVLEKMNDWCKKVHEKSGLCQRVLHSAWSEKEVEQAALHFLSRWVAPHTAPLFGNTISQDRRFLRRYMTSLENYFHYRNVDISSLKELVRAWKPEILQYWKKEHPHQALEDLKASVEELKFYREYFLNLIPSTPLAQKDPIIAQISDPLRPEIDRHESGSAPRASV